MTRWEKLRYEFTRRRKYLGLCYRVFKINRKAAWYLLTEVRKTKSFTYHSHLDCCVQWDNTKQGWRYWSEIQHVLNERKRHA